MDFYFDYHRLETVNKNPIHPIAFLKNHINSKLFEKMREGGGFIFSRSLSSKCQKKPYPLGVFTKNLCSHDGRMVLMPFMGV